MVIELTFVLLLMVNGERAEYTAYSSLSDCLAVRRKIKRNVGHTHNFDQKWSCKQLRVKLKDGQISGFVEE